MTSFERHDFVTLNPDWSEQGVPLPDAADAHRIAQWQAEGLPFVVAARRHGDGVGSLRLGLAGPDKARLSFLVADGAIAGCQPPPLLRTLTATCPQVWQPLLARLDALAGDFDLTLRVYGSAAWQALSGQRFLGPASDLDLLILPGPAARLSQALEALDALEGPMRLDGEVRLAGLGDVAWREWRCGADRVLVKTRQGPRLIARREAA